jgi:hypothetical protein
VPNNFIFTFLKKYVIINLPNNFQKLPSISNAQKGDFGMKKSIFIILPAFTLGNATFLSLGMTCLLDLLSISVGISLDSEIEYPRFIPFCIILGIVALLGVGFLLFGNIKISEKIIFTKWIWYFQYIFAFVLSIPMIKLWQMLFDFLQKTI